MPQIKDVMTPNCCYVSPDTPISDVAQKMLELDCGFIPVAENEKLIGVVTDRDIAIRAVAKGLNPKDTPARDVMTEETFYCYDHQEIDLICDNMGEMQVRRMPVVDKQKNLVGVVSLGDLAQEANQLDVGEAEQQITEGVQYKKVA